MALQVAVRSHAGSPLLAEEPDDADNGKVGQDLWLRDHIHACTTPHGTVFLDAQHNRYFGVGMEETRALSLLLRNPPPRFSVSGFDPSLIDAAQVHTIADDFVKAGVLTPERPGDSAFRTLTVGLEERLYSVGQELECQTRVRLDHAVNLIRACVATTLDIKFRSIDSIARELRLKKGHVREAQTFPSDQDILQLVCIFRRLRPYVFQARDHCLFHALTLVRFLLQYHAPAMWVIGVKTKPWGAHSWVQHETLILDSSPERVVEYTPILVV